MVRSIIGKAFDDNGVKLTPRNTLPPEKRTQKVFSALIASMRTAEAKVHDTIDDLRDKLEDQQEKNQTLVERLGKMEMELAKMKLATCVSSIPALEDSEQQRLLAII